MPRCYVALGGNVGSVEDTFAEALRRLDDGAEVLVGAMSRVYATDPVGEQAGGEFCNAAVAIDTRLAPLDLLDRLQAVETKFGRRRDVHWGPRTLDLDVIFYGDEIIDEPRLRVPHPACWYRRFVLDPLAEIAADVVHPEKGITVGALRDRLLARPLRVALAGADERTCTQLMGSLGPEFPQVAFEHWEREGSGEQRAESREPEPEPALLFWLGAKERRTGEPPFYCLDASKSGEASAVFIRDVLASALCHSRPLRNTP